MTIAHPAPPTTEEQDHPHACLEGYIYLGYTAVDEESGGSRRFPAAAAPKKQDR